MQRILYTYFRSSAAWRVRIALAFKGLEYTAVPVHLLRNGGEQHADAYRELNPQEMIPALLEEGELISQSLAICEYLDECYPTPPLLPATPVQRALVRSLALSIACDIHPINNLRVMQYLKGPLGHDQQAADEWSRHWMAVGFTALEARLTKLGSEQCCVGTTVTLADLCLVPQVANARRLHLDLTPFPHIVGIDAYLSALPAFAGSHPSQQPDAE